VIGGVSTYPIANQRSGCVDLFVNGFFIYVEVTDVDLLINGCFKPYR